MDNLDKVRDHLRSILLKRTGRGSVRVSRPNFHPSKWTVGTRHIRYLGPMTNVTIMLSHLGDKEFFTPTRDGTHLTWTQIVDLFLKVNPTISWSDVHRELRRPVEGK